MPVTWLPVDIWKCYTCLGGSVLIFGDAGTPTGAQGSVLRGWWWWHVNRGQSVQGEELAL